MFSVNRNVVDPSGFAARLRAFGGGMEHFRRVEGGRFALCVADPVDLIALVVFIRERGGSALLIHGDTPPETALRTASAAGCCGLIDREPERFLPLAADAEPEREPAVFQFSSGTTGRPKLIRRTWGEIRAEIAAYSDALGPDGSLSPVVLAPVSHSYGLICGVLVALERGCRPAIVTNRNPKYMLGVIRDTPDHLVYGVPSLFHVMTGFSREPVRFRKLMTSGAPMPEPLFDRLNAVSDAVMQQYGCSEAGCISLCRRTDTNRDVGRPLAHLRVTASRDGTKPSEIVVETRVGTIHTGDLGYVNETGTLRLVARMDDVINVSGLKVYPTELEDVISRMTGVREAVVYRGRHPVMGEIVKAQVAADSGVTPDAVRNWCMRRLPAFKVPHEVRCVAEIPKNAAGKISRNLLEMEDDAT